MAPPVKSVRDKIDALLRRKASGKKCKRHKNKLVKLAFVWADGRAYGFACDRQCLLDWEESQGRWACVVRVVLVNI